MAVLELHSRAGSLVSLTTCLLMFISYSSFTVLVPFFGDAAEAKANATEIEVGIMFSILFVASLISSPFFTSYSKRAGRRRVMLIGGCLGAVGTMSFALASILDGKLFLVWCGVTRAIQGVGLGAAGTAGYSIIGSVFRGEDIVRSLVYLQVAVGLGGMIGPVVGGVLYEYIGFVYPFIIIGSVFVLLLPLIVYAVPEDTEPVMSVRRFAKKREDATFLRLIAIPEVLFGSLSAVLGVLAGGFLDPTLPRHLERLHFSYSLIGVVFMVYMIAYAAASFLQVYFRLIHFVHLSFLIIFGLFIIACGFLLYAPSPIFRIRSQVWFVFVGQIFLGIGNSLIFVCQMPYLLSYSSHYNNASDEVAAILNITFALGDAVGPLVGSGLESAIGFPWATTVFAGFIMVFALTYICVLLVRKYVYNVRPHVPTEESPLLNNRSTYNTPHFLADSKNI
eukprot:GILJ01005348.1.p1 GENE.GILJ01005348.1~~GILJ01005348.1.p1  ORF type:complete len:465 (-),score=48.18 GILJ01005348.1:190-1536(-)